jgi:hypothetical protein
LCHVSLRGNTSFYGMLKRFTLAGHSAQVPGSLGNLSAIAIFSTTIEPNLHWQLRCSQ